MNIKQLKELIEDMDDNDQLFIDASDHKYVLGRAYKVQMAYTGNYEYSVDIDIFSDKPVVNGILLDWE